MLLARSQVVHYITKVSVDLIVVFEVLVHFIRFLLKTSNLHLTRSDVTLQLLYLVVEYELELLEFLGLLLELIDLLLTIAYEFVLGTDLSGLVLDLFLQSFENFLLVADLYVLFLFIALKFFYVILKILMFVLCKLQLSLTLQGHILHLSLILHVLLVDFVDFELGICLYLSESLLIVLFDLSDVVLQLFSRVASSLHVLTELLELISHTLVMFADYAVDLVFILARLLLFLSL